MDYEELRKTLAGATPGPWYSMPHGVTNGLSLEDGDEFVCRVSATLGKYEPEVLNRDYIAAANPEVIRALLDERDMMLAAIQGALSVLGTGGPCELCQCDGCNHERAEIFAELQSVLVRPNLPT